MTRLEALRRVLSSPRDHVDQGRIGRRVIAAAPDGRERMARPKPKSFREWADRYDRWRAA